MQQNMQKSDPSQSQQPQLQSGSLGFAEKLIHMPNVSAQMPTAECARSLKHIPQCMYKYKGTLDEQLVSRIVEDLWNITVVSVKHLVGYDVSNYLIEGVSSGASQAELSEGEGVQAQKEQGEQGRVQASRSKQVLEKSQQSRQDPKVKPKQQCKKYIAKVYKNLAAEQRQVLDAQNDVLEYLQQYGQSHASYQRYPKPVPIPRRPGTLHHLPTIHAFPTQSAIRRFKNVATSKENKQEASLGGLESGVFVVDASKSKYFQGQEYEQVEEKVQGQGQGQVEEKKTNLMLQQMQQMQQYVEVQVQTDKNICYDLQDNRVVYPVVCQDTAATTSKSIGRYVAHVEVTGSHSGLNSQQSKPIELSVRVLQFIEGTMLGQCYEHILNVSTNTDYRHDRDDREDRDRTNRHHLMTGSDSDTGNGVDMGVLHRELPIFIASQVTQPLLAYTHAKGSGMAVSTFKSRQWEWHIQSFLQNFYRLRYGLVCQNADRPHWHGQVIAYFVQLYGCVLGQLDRRQLRQCLIHNDLNEWNIVIHSNANNTMNTSTNTSTNKSTDKGMNKNSSDDAPQISVIDFGDLAYSYLIQDISIYVLYLIYHQPQPEFIHRHMVRAIHQYSQVVPITPEELMLYYVTVPMRMCLSLCNSEYAMTDRPHDAYLGMSQRNGWQLLRVMRDMYQDTGIGSQIQISASCQHNGKIINSKLFTQLQKHTSMANNTNTAATQVGKTNPLSAITIVSSEQGQVWSEEDYPAWESAEGDEKHRYDQQEEQHVRDLLCKYYQNIVSEHGIQKQAVQWIQVRRCPGYSTKNFKVVLPAPEKEQSRQAGNAYILKVYIRENSRLLQYTQIQSQILTHIVHSQLSKRQTSGNGNGNGGQFILRVPRPVQINSGGSQNDDEGQQKQYCAGFYDQFWHRDVIIRLLEYVPGYSYNSYFSALELQDAATDMEILNQEMGLSFNHKQMAEQTSKLSNLHKFYRVVQSFGTMLATLHTELKSSLESLSLTNEHHKKQLCRYLKRKDYEWFVEHVHVWQKQIGHVSDSKTKNNIKYFLQLYQENVQSVIQKGAKGSKNGTANEWGHHLRTWLVHLDPTQDNCLISDIDSANPQVDSIIDFDQIQVQYLINDLAVTIVHCFHPIPKTIKCPAISPSFKYRANTLHPIYKKTISILIAKYHSILPLNLEELRCLYYFIGARLSMCIILESRDILQNPGNHHIDFDLQFLKEAIDSLAKIDPSEFYQLLKGACFGKQFQSVRSNSQGFRIQGNCPISIIHKVISNYAQINSSNCEIAIKISNILWSYDWVKIKLQSDTHPPQKSQKAISLSQLLQQQNIDPNQKLSSNQIEKLLSLFQTTYASYKVEPEN